MRSRIAHAEGDKPLIINLPIGIGIAGRVAATGETQNIADPYSHPDFNPAVDRDTGYRTRSILCMPIYDRKKQIFAVAELLNKIGNEPFSDKDEAMFRDFAESLGLILESCMRMAPSTTAVI